jgi:hypothetical protein
MHGIQNWSNKLGCFVATFAIMPAGGERASFGTLMSFEVTAWHFNDFLNLISSGSTKMYCSI